MESEGEFTGPVAKEAFHFMVNAWNSVTIESFQHCWNIKQIIENKVFQLMDEITQVED